MTREALKKMIYSRRFFILPFLVVFAMAFFISLKPLGEQLYDLFNQEENLSLQLAEKEKAVQQIGMLGLNVKHSSVGIYSLLRQLQQAAALSQLQVLNMGIESKGNAKNAENGNEDRVLKAKFSGDFLSFLNFWLQLYHRNAPLYLTHLVLSPQEDRLMISLQAAISSVMFLPTEKENSDRPSTLKINFRDPFQEAVDPSLLLSVLAKDARLDRLMLQELRYVGYLVQGLKKVALLLLPDGDIHEVSEGDFLGKEKWQVLAIQPHALTLKTRNTHIISTVRRG